MSTTHHGAREAAEQAQAARFASAADDDSDAAKAQAANLHGKGRNETQRRADQAKGFASQQVGAVADALDDAAANVAQGGAAQAVLSRAATGAHDVAQAIEDRSFSEAGVELAAFARSRPGLFIGGAVLAGFAAARFASAKPEASPDDDVAEDAAAPPPPASAPDAPHLRPAPATDTPTTTVLSASGAPLSSTTGGGAAKGAS